MGFPYYLKIGYFCQGRVSDDLIRRGHLTGLKPMVLVTFHSPVNFYRWKMELLQIQMEAAPFLSKDEYCRAEELCFMGWYTPMPIKNGSVVMHVDVSSNGLGPYIPKKRFYVNINGYLKMEQNSTKFTIGKQVFRLIPRYFNNFYSQPLWYTVDQAPVLILGGIPNEKLVLLTDTNFEDFSLLELNIDSCWVESFSCPHSAFTATIYDTIATESTLFIRQNQLVYYFTGNYSKLRDINRKDSWVRILANECIKKLCPVEFHSNGSEYVIALTTGQNEGYIHFGTITDGRVSFEKLPKYQSPCQSLQTNCSILWTVYINANNELLLLVENIYTEILKTYLLVSYNLFTEQLIFLYELPRFIPDAQGLKFVMLQKLELSTKVPLTPLGLFFNPYNNMLFIWGNFIVQSYDHENYFYLSDFPKESVIKYLVNSYHGDMAIVTESEEVWYLLEGSYDVYRLYPSEGWDMHISIQMMRQSPFYSYKETMVTLFYEDSQLYQLVYVFQGPKSGLIKRLVPVEQILMYLKLRNSHLDLIKKALVLMNLNFSNLCPFTVMRLENVPNPQKYTRQERYQALPPRVLTASGFHSEDSLAVYQGLVYYLLWLHSEYDKPYAEPVHDPTWRWWESKKHDQSYYFYLASNWQSESGVYVEMESYEKFYHLQPEAELPERIFLDKGSSYSFSIRLTARKGFHSLQPMLGTNFLLDNQLGLGVMLAHPKCIKATVTERVIISQNSMVFHVSIRDRRQCFDHGISGRHLKRTSVLVKVMGSAGQCFQNTHLGPRTQGRLMLPVLIGCPPGKRLVFDVTFTLQYNLMQNKHYFDCIKADPEMPCFHFRDIFYPFFLIQDVVTGNAGRFMGKYMLKVVGGGPTLDSIQDYSKEEIFHYNSHQDNQGSGLTKVTTLHRTGSLIWTVRNKTVMDKNMTLIDGAFHVFKYGLNLGIEWLCLENSPCHDIMPQSIFSPEFFFKVLVSNRGVDENTYCNYQLIFLLHIHGIPLSTERSLFFLIVSASMFGGLVVVYLIFCFLWPFVVKGCYILRWKINSMITTDSYYTYVSSSRAFSLQSNISTMPSRLSNWVYDRDRADSQ
ncbi:PREDICTED: cation channel sperm-associated protein subunit gamma [Elephantulus edwardii]|uniref:cation channel sperm-associated protein subunit gamma n=1 Tax=Elephantulus edwardii TaxID=28737 RepID=UPI0003F0D31A|nr:PREDICTED: cation channel sperm-associated protein subunit gamma [Elephantulus edwardii]